ncbi:TPM domain-containing protein [Candidatus Avoscillospira sp. LCP25S3_F1]|uniref:TPM domain-containing protein n=1 Tax=Candidatus Avoscillospira sp. LCP25S3_F1 TaxID=3438825 RepID=UPI003F8D94FB
MKLLNNRVFASLLTAAVVLGCCAYGFFGKPNETAADQTALEYGREHYSSYLDWIADEADLLSDNTERTVATYLGALDHGWGSIVAVVTEDSGGADLQTRAKDWAARGNLSGRDMVLLLDAASGHWYLQPGADIGPYVDQKLTTTVTACFDGRSVTGDADEILAELFPDLYSWYEDTLTAQENDGFLPILLAFGFVALLILVIAIASAASLGRGRRGGGGPGSGFDDTVRRRRNGPTIFWGPTVFFPGRFGGPFGPPHGRPGRHSHPNHHGNPSRNGDDWPFGGGGGFGGGFGNGGFDGGDRGGGFGDFGGFGGGGFNGGDRGGGFGG